MGWRRYGIYLRHRLGRMQGTPHSVAAGFAAGAAMSMTPFMGLHIALSLALAWLLRGNLISAALGTLVGNPWTLPFILLGIYNIGCLLLGQPMSDSPFHGVSFGDALHHPWSALEPIFWPMVLGSIPAATVVWFLAYWPLRRAIERYKMQRTERRHARALELLNRMKLDAHRNGNTLND